MNNDNKLVPKYRFPAFKDDENWQISPLSDKIDYERPDKYIVKNSNYINKGTPVLTANKSFVLGYTDENEGIYEDNLPVIIFDDFTVDNKYVDFPFKVKSSAIKILKNKNEDDSLKFFYELMSQIKFDAKEHKRYYISAYQKIEVPVPSNPAEQQKIAACLSSLDDVIAGHEEKLTALEEHKKGLLQNLFPQQGETQPKYRFPEFENAGDWVEKRLGEIGDPLMCKRIFKEETTIFKEGNIPFYKIGTFGKVPDAFISVEKYKDYKQRFSFPKKGDILISASGTIGRLVIYDGKPAYFQDSNIIWLGHEEDVIKNTFLLYVYENLNWQTSDGGIISRLYNSDFKKMEIKFPENPSEQQKLASFLSSVDELIVAQRVKIVGLKEHKKGLMQGLFPIIEN